MRDTKLRWIHRQNILVRLLCFIAVAVLLMLPKVGWNLATTGTHYWINMGRSYSFCVLYPAALILLYGWGRLAQQQARPFRAYGLELNKRAAKEWGLGFAVGLCGVLAYMTYFIIVHSVHWNHHNHFGFSLMGTELSWLLGAIGFVLVEELFFRGFLFSEAYNSSQKAWLAVLFSAVMFACLHFHPHWYLPLFAMGLLLAQAKCWFQSRIAFGAGLHTAWVFFFWGMGMAHMWAWAPGSIGANPFNRILVILLLMQCAVLFFLQRRRRVK